MDLFDIEKGKAPTPTQRFIYRLVNRWVPNFIRLLVMLFFVSMCAGFCFIVLHFIVKYW